MAGYGGEVFSYRSFNWFWVPVLGPFIGAAFGGLLYQLTIGFHNPSDTDDIHIRKYEIVATEERKPLTTGEKLAAVVAVEQEG
ncbi:unnamed protein product [Gongylonema pulchrum]|uniref:Aquaporin n=1 Tax=Gongylonema pulchrum TaxID=637853 RepID=A0A183DFE6_9BILA|nr:unnamed protein product [Gongylonema pulchrum]